MNKNQKLFIYEFISDICKLRLQNAIYMWRKNLEEFADKKSYEAGIEAKMIDYIS